MKGLYSLLTIILIISFICCSDGDNNGRASDSIKRGSDAIDIDAESVIDTESDGELIVDISDDNLKDDDVIADWGIEDNEIDGSFDDIYELQRDVATDLCVPDCSMKCGGASDGCGGVCNNDCPDGYFCNNEKRCEKKAQPRCGDSNCDSNENACTCPSDCKPKCGDGCCSIGESKTNCPNDCLIDCLKLSYSTYNLMYQGYSEAEVRHFIVNAANAGSEFIRVMGIMDLECCRGNKDWVFGPWKRRPPSQNECVDDRGNPRCYYWPYWNLNEWDEDYFSRLNFIVDTASQYGIKVLFTIFPIQENPLQYIGPDNILSKLSEFIDELKRRGFANRIHDWEIDNEGGTGLFSPEGDDPDGSIYFEYTRRLGEKIRNTLGGTLYHSGEAPGLLAPVYDVYMPHNWLGPNPIESLGGNGFEDSEGINYVDHIRKDYGKAILPSSDGGMPNLCDDNAIRALLRKTYELNWIGFEVDIGWYTSPDGGCHPWGNGTPNTGKISDIEWNLVQRTSQIAEEMFPTCKYIRGPIVPFVNNRLGPNETLLPSKGITSENGKYGLYFQSDCNLVLYDISGGNNNWKPIWASNTASQCSPKWLIMQGDGNLVIVDVNDKAVWASGTNGHDGAYLVIRDDGKIAIIDKNGNILWIKP